jgi:mannose-6-phosphate isomerase-like protein (cupin superfamily)
MLIKKLDQPGSLLSLGETKRLKSGLVLLKPSEEVSWHITEEREEVIIVLEGQATIYFEGGKKQIVDNNHLIYIPLNKKHKVRNESNKALLYIYLVSLDL